MTARRHQLIEKESDVYKVFASDPADIDTQIIEFGLPVSLLTIALEYASLPLCIRYAKNKRSAIRIGAYFGLFRHCAWDCLREALSVEEQSNMVAMLEELLKEAGNDDH